MGWVAAAGTLLLSGCGDGKKNGAQSGTDPATTGGPVVVAKSGECRSCHQESFDKWTGSHHQLAHRDTGGTPEDALAYAGQVVKDGPGTWKFEGGMQHPALSWSDSEDKDARVIDKQEIPKAIGFVPLVQYLVPSDDGRYQIPDMSWDPARKEWFSIYAGQDRRPFEWGHWTQRGMNWNTQCAYCHHTEFRKNFDSESDSYHSTWVEQGIGCAQCHGTNTAKPAANGCTIDYTKKFTKKEWMHSCATCHARREELDENFRIGDSFHDHYRLALPSQPGLYYADGQQLDEVYKWPSFLLSRMGHKGIACNDCHDGHTAKTKFEIDFNTLCMQCHATGENEATVIDVGTHMHHTAGTEGWRCVDCHMMQTPYMGRDPRRDHMFPLPDPQMTKDLGVPNACNKCHAEEGIDWQIDWVNKWYGEKMKKYEPRRQRTRAIAAAYAHQRGVLDKLLESYATEEIGAWRATLLRLMDPWNNDTRVGDLAAAGADDADPLVRGASAMILGRRGDHSDKFEKLLADPLKAVRFDAAWAALDRLPADSPGVALVEQVARHQSDQPAGAMRLARLATIRNQRGEAEKWYRKALDWDRGSPAPRRDFAVFLATDGRIRESLAQLEDAEKLAPNDAEIPYLQALAHSELSDQARQLARQARSQGNQAEDAKYLQNVGEHLAEAEQCLRRTVKIDPLFGRAHYNLGLLLSSTGRPQKAVASLKQAAAVDRNDPSAPYAEATILLHMGQLDAAAAAAREALRRNPNHQQAQQLLEQIGR